MKTIAITSFHTLISRNILATPFFDSLKSRKDLRIVLVVPNFKAKFFEERFGGENIFVYGAEQYKASKYFTGLLFKRLGMIFYDTPTTRMKKSYKYYWDKKLLYYIASVAAGWLGKSFTVRAIIRYFDLRFSPKDIFKPLFDQYTPDLIFSTDVQNEDDVALAQDATRRGVPVCGMIRSWDNPTQRTLRFWPDKLFVGSRALYEEVIKYYRYPKEKIAITGQPHYDRYLVKPKTTREEFFAKYGLDPKKKLILYTASGNLLLKNNDYDQYLMEVLGELPYQILARFPLSGEVTLVDFKKPANLVINIPGEKFGDTKQMELRLEDDISLIEQLTYSDVVVTGPTSICIDSALLDKPVISAEFYKTLRHKYEGNWGFGCAHIMKMWEFGGVSHAMSKEELFAAIEAYLKDSKKDAIGRERMRAHWFSNADGHASERLVNEILKLINI